MTEPILVGIVDDHTLFRNGVAGLMNEFAGLKVVFEADNGKHMQQLLGKAPRPKVILMDINMPLMDGYESTAWLKDNYPDIRVLALSMFDDDKAVIKMIRCGACGYVLKVSKPIDLFEAISTVFTKGLFINEMVSGKLMHSVKFGNAEPGLTQKETDFLKLCCSELTYKEIADIMCVSPRTIDNYRETLFAKLNLKSRTGLVLYAIKTELFKF